MAYTKTTWESGVTALSADNMNNIENGITEIDNNTLKIPTNDRAVLTDLTDNTAFTAPKSGWLMVRCTATGETPQPYLEIVCSGVGILNSAWGASNNGTPLRCCAPVKEGVNYYIHFTRCTFADAFIFY